MDDIKLNVLEKLMIRQKPNVWYDLIARQRFHPAPGVVPDNSLDNTVE